MFSFSWCLLKSSILFVFLFFFMLFLMGYVFSFVESFFLFLMFIKECYQMSSFFFFFCSLFIKCLLSGSQKRRLLVSMLLMLWFLVSTLIIFFTCGFQLTNFVDFLQIPHMVDKYFGLFSFSVFFVLSLLD